MSRRYSLNELSRIISEELKRTSLSSLNCVGLLYSLGNGLVLKDKISRRQQITLWDEVMVPLSRLLDPMLHYSKIRISPSAKKEGAE